nr:Chain B, Axin peptide [Homo sapiens]
LLPQKFAEELIHRLEAV